MNKRWIGIGLIVAAAAVMPVAAQHGGGRPGMPPRAGEDFIGKLLFPPEMVLQNQAKLGLSEQQIADIKKLLSETHSVVVDRQVDMAAAAETLRNALEAHPINEEAALAAADSVVELENGIKRVHLSLLIRLNNLLTAEQVETLRAMRPPRN